MSFSFSISGADKAAALTKFAAMIEQAAQDNDLSSEIIAALEGNAEAQVALLPDADPRPVRISIDAVQDGATWVAFQVSVGLIDGS